MLDFGLAKLAERTDGGPDAETVTADERPQTEEGSDRRHGRLHVARADRRQEGRCAIGYFFLRLGTLRDGHRPARI